MIENWQARQIELNGQHHFVRWTSEGKTPLFLIHGFTDSGHYWSRLAADLEDQFSVFMPDMLGHGQSDRLSGPVTLTEFADHVVAIMDLFGIEKCHLCGHSMGGLIVSTLATNYPDRVQTVILEDPAWSLNEAKPPIYLGQFERTRQWREDHNVLRQMSRNEARQKILVGKEGWHPMDIEIHLDDRLQYDPAIFDYIDFGVGVLWQEQISDVPVQILLLMGEAELGSIISETMAEIFLARAMLGETAVILGAGHGIHREQYEGFREIVASFLQKQP